MNTPANWWRTFFSGPFVDFWLAATTDRQTEQEADFIEQSLRVSAPAKLLDVPCGGGRHCRALSKRGFEMTGVDISAGFLEAARADSTAGPGNITFEQREMVDLPWRERFQGAFSFGNSFAYLDDEGNAAFLKAVSDAVEPGSSFVLETGYVSDALLPVLQERSWYELGDMIVLSKRCYDPATSRLHVEYTLIRGSAIDRQSMSARLYSYRELLGLFAEAGFTKVEGYGSLDREPFKLGSRNLFLVGTKPGKP